MLSRWQSTIVDAQGNVQPGAVLTIRNESDQSLATVYMSPSELQPYPQGQVPADAAGYAYFYARGGLYRIQSVALGIDWRHVPLGDLQGMDEADLGLGTAASRNIGGGPSDVPTNDDLGSAAFLNLSIEDIQWLGAPIGGYITTHEAPPIDDPRFRYVLCSAGQTGAGGYNHGALTNETLTGTSPLINASAEVSLEGSPMNGHTIRLVNTTREFFRPGTPSDTPQDSENKIHFHEFPYEAPTTAGGGAWTYQAGVNNRRTQSGTSNSGGVEARPRNTPVVYYRRVL